MKNLIILSVLLITSQMSIGQDSTTVTYLENLREVVEIYKPIRTKKKETHIKSKIEEPKPIEEKVETEKKENQKPERPKQTNTYGWKITGRIFGFILILAPLLRIVIRIFKKYNNKKR